MTSLHSVQLLGLTVLCAVGLVFIWQSVSATETRVRSLLEMARTPPPVCPVDHRPIPLPTPSPPPPTEFQAEPSAPPMPQQPEEEVRALDFGEDGGEIQPVRRVQFAE